MLRILELQLQLQVIFDSIEFLVRRIPEKKAALSEGLPGRILQCQGHPFPTPKGSLWERDALGMGRSPWDLRKNSDIG